MELQKPQLPAGTSVPDYLKSLQADTLASDPYVRYKFITLYNQINGKNDGVSKYETEHYHWNRYLNARADLKDASKISLYGSFIDLAVMDLSLDPSKKLAYVECRNVNVGSAQNKIYEKTAFLKVSPYGELALRMSCGQIAYADTPMIVYEGDIFTPYINEKGHKMVRYEGMVPRKSENIIAAFIKIVRPDGSIDYPFMTKAEIDRLKGYSNRQNFNKGANELYSSGVNGQIDTGFLMAKMIKHAFKAFPKVQLRGQHTELEEEVENNNVNYMDDDGPQQQQQQFQQPVQQQQSSQPAQPSNPAISVDPKSAGNVIDKEEIF